MSSETISATVDPSEWMIMHSGPVPTEKEIGDILRSQASKMLRNKLQPYLRPGSHVAIRVLPVKCVNGRYVAAAELVS